MPGVLGFFRILVTRTTCIAIHFIVRSEATIWTPRVDDFGRHAMICTACLHKYMIYDIFVLFIYYTCRVYHTGMKAHTNRYVFLHHCCTYIFILFCIIWAYVTIKDTVHDLHVHITYTLHTFGLFLPVQVRRLEGKHVCSDVHVFFHQTKGWYNVDGSEILRLVVYPVIYRVSYISGVCLGFQPSAVSHLPKRSRITVELDVKIQLDQWSKPPIGWVL